MDLFSNFLDELVDERGEEINFPSGNVVSDLETYHDFMDSFPEKYFVKKPGLEACLRYMIISHMVKTLKQSLDNRDINIKTYKNYETKFKLNFNDYLEKTDGNNNNKYKFLEKESISNLKSLLKKAGYKGYSKLNKKQLVSYIIREIEMY